LAGEKGRRSFETAHFFILRVDFETLKSPTMKQTIFFPALCLGLLLFSCQPKVQEDVVSSEAVSEVETTMAYDSVLAEQLGADDYGMKTYVFAFLKTGPNRSEDAATAAELQKAHLANIRRLAEEGNLVLAGPFMGGDETLRGVYIFNTSSLEEARSWTESDPAVQAGSLVMELHPWYGSAALQQLNEWSQKITKTSF
jgi:uncharacterized protein YciI